MQDSKKAFFVTVAFLLIIFIVSSLVIEPYVHSELYYYNDANRRDQLAGTIDFAILGASHALTSLDPRVIDEELGCNSYNYSGSLMTWNCREAILLPELERNPIDTLILEVSYNSLVLPKYETESNLYTYPRISSYSKRLEFLLKNQSISDVELLYADALNSGSQVVLGQLYKIYKARGQDFVNILNTPYKRDLVYENKGFLSRQHNNITLSETEAAELYESEELNLNFEEYNLNSLELIIDNCQKNEINVIVVVVPISDGAIWKMHNWDDFYLKIANLCKEYNCEFFDFNLLKNRYDLFSDSTSFSDSTHMCEAGAAVFSRTFCEILKQSSFENTADLFYSSYAEMIQDSPYMDLRKNCDN